MVWPKIRQTEKARKFDGTTLSFVYPGAMATPLLPLIGWIFENVVDSINIRRRETKLCSFVYFIYVTIFLFYVKKKENQRTSSSCFGEQVIVVHVRDSLVVNGSVATDPSPNAHQWAPTPALNSLWPFQTQLSIRCVVFSESTIREYCRDHVVGRQMIQLLVCSRRKWTGGFFILAWHFLRVRDSVRLMVKAWESRQGRDCWQPC